VQEVQLARKRMPGPDEKWLISLYKKASSVRLE
jgi:hypothetical protein